MPFDDLHKRHREMFDEANTSFDQTFARTQRLAVAVAIFWGVVILAVLGLAAYLVLSLV